MKYIPVNGLKFTNSFALHWFGVNNRKIVEFDFFTKKILKIYRSIYVIIQKMTNLIQ